MNEKLYLLQPNNNQSINPELADNTLNTITQSAPDNIIVPIVPEDSVDTDMSDKIVKTETTNTPRPENKTEQKEKTGLFKRVWNTVKKTVNSIANGAEQLYKRGVIKVAELTDSETILEYAHSIKELNDKNLERLANADVKSKHQNIRQKAGEITAKIKDTKLQLDTSLRHTQDGDDDVRLGYARNLPDMHAENQAPIAGNIAEYSVSAAPTQEVINQMPNCATEEQANVVNATTRGIVANKNYTEEIITELGTNTAKQITNLAESQQAKAYSVTANNMYKYEKVVVEVLHQVANIASENVRQEVIEKLQNSEYENVKNSFTPENIKKVQEEYKCTLNIEEKTPETIQKTENNPAEAATEYKETGTVKETEIIENTTEEKQVSAKNTTNSTNSNNKYSSNKAGNITSLQDKNTYSNTLKAFKECKSIKDVEEVIKNASHEDVKKFYTSLNENQRLGLFKNTQSPDIQLAMLKGGFVKYEDVHSNLLPAVNSILAVYTLNNEIEKAIQLA